MSLPVWLGVCLCVQRIIGILVFNVLFVSLLHLDHYKQSLTSSFPERTLTLTGVSFLP